MPDCPKGWTLVSMPSKPDDLEWRSQPVKGFLTSAKYTYWRTGKYEWVPAEGVMPVQGSCGAATTFAANFYVEKNSVHTINLGANFKVYGETAELSGGYSYSFGGTTGAGTSVQETIGPTPGAEYLMTPLVLRFRICGGYLRDSLPWYEVVKFFVTGTTLTDQRFLNYIATYCDNYIYLRGSLMICKRACG